jgi:D-psicose/D-tagatose/L-ribulose 3-epimerase
MRLGINTFLFSCPFTNRSTRYFSQFQQWGFESVEISIESFSDIDPTYVYDQSQRHGLVCGSVTPCMGPDRDLRGTVRQQRTGIQFLKGVIDRMGTLGARTLAGVVYSVVGRADAMSASERRRQWRTVVRNLREVADYAGERGSCIALEPVNRFETDFINTCDQGLEMIHDVGSPALKLHLDTFHMNIEEKDPAAAIRRAGNRLGHLHACGTDRGTPGNDHFDWPATAAALKSISYQGDVVIESFTSDVKAVARAASIWRKIEPVSEDIARKGIVFLKTLLRSGKSGNRINPPRKAQQNFNR